MAMIAYLSTADKSAALSALLAYARAHGHSRQWIAPLTRWLAKGGAAYG